MSALVTFVFFLFGFILGGITMWSDVRKFVPGGWRFFFKVRWGDEE